MSISTHFDVVAIENVSAHDFGADVSVIPSTVHGSFVSLDLNVGRGQVKFLLPASAYQAARNIADLWPTLGDRKRPAGGSDVRLSDEALALVGGLQLGADIVPPITPEHPGEREPEVAEIGDDGA